MRIFDIHDADGRLYAFEVSNTLLGRRQACKIAARIAGSTLIKTSRLFRDSDDFCEFEIGGTTYLISEPFGDNSRFWIGPKVPPTGSHLGVIRAAFGRHRWWRSPLQTPMFWVALVALLAGANQVQRFINQDRCLDSGGRWNHKHSICEQSGP